MSDADYASFLDKASSDSNAGASREHGGGSYGSKSVDGRVPKVLEDVQEYYVSEADEAFEPVALEVKDGKGLSAETLKALVPHAKSVHELSGRDFDPRGQYGGVVDAVRKAASSSSSADVKFFRVELSATRAEMWVVGLEDGGDDGKGKKRLVGLKALSVES